MSRSKVKPKVWTKEFGNVNLQVSMSENEVRVWACDPKTGQNLFRLKTIGKVHAADISQIVVTDRY